MFFLRFWRSGYKTTMCTFQTARFPPILQEHSDKALRRGLLMEQHRVQLPELAIDGTDVPAQCTSESMDGPRAVRSLASPQEWGHGCHQTP